MPEPENNQPPIEKTLASLKRDYVAVSARRIKPWQAWLAVGVLAGVLGGIMFVANREGLLEGIFASGTPNAILGYRISSIGGVEGAPPATIIIKDSTGTVIGTYTDNPYNTGYTLPDGIYTVSSSIPDGYEVSYSTNDDVWNPASYTQGNSMTIDFSDTAKYPNHVAGPWWRYVPFVYKKEAGVPQSSSRNAPTAFSDIKITNIAFDVINIPNGTALDACIHIRRETDPKYPAVTAGYSEVMCWHANRVTAAEDWHINTDLTNTPLFVPAGTRVACGYKLFGATPEQQLDLKSNCVLSYAPYKEGDARFRILRFPYNDQPTDDTNAIAPTRYQSSGLFPLHVKGVNFFGSFGLHNSNASAKPCVVWRSGGKLVKNACFPLQTISPATNYTSPAFLPLDWSLAVGDILTATCKVTSRTDCALYVLVEIPPAVTASPENIFRDYQNVPHPFLENWCTKYSANLDHHYYCDNQPSCSVDTKIQNCVKLFTAASCIQNNLCEKPIVASTPNAILGYRISSTGGMEGAPPATITVKDSAGTVVGTYTNNPYNTGYTLPAGIYTISSSVPDGYEVSYYAGSFFDGNPDNAKFQDPTAYIKGTSVTIDTRNFHENTMHVWWRYALKPVEGFVKVSGKNLMVNGQVYRFKGANYLGGRYINPFIKDDKGFEHYNLEQIFHDFNEAEIEKELQFLKNALGVNTIRQLTPSKDSFRQFVKWHFWDPWFMLDGSINPIYRDRLVRLIDIAGRNGIRVELELFHNIGSAGSSEWKCKENEAWGLCTKPLETYVAENVRFVAPGSPGEQFYLTYLRSLIPVLKDHPAILAYEVGNENLLYSPINYWQHSYFEERMLSFIKRMITEIRVLDQNHLITTGEVVPPPGGQYATAWHWPAPEFALISDVDNLNGGQPYSLYSLVDYISPHFYLKANEVDAAASLIKGKSAKPVAMSEFGYLSDDLMRPPPGDLQVQYFQAIGAAIKTYRLSGAFVWDPLPIVDLKPGTYRLDSERPPWDPTKDHPIVVLFGPPERKIKFIDLAFKLFDENLLPNAAAKVLKEFAF